MVSGSGRGVSSRPGPHGYIRQLVQRLPYQLAIKDVQAMIKPAEGRYLDFQPKLEETAAEILRNDGPKAAEAFLTAYTSDCAKQVGSAYSELVDYLMLRFLVGDSEFARPELPRIAAPMVPEKATQAKRP